MLEEKFMSVLCKVCRFNKVKTYKPGQCLYCPYNILIFQLLSVQNVGHHCDIPYINMVHFNHIHFLHYSYFFFASPFSLSPPLSEWPGTIYPSCPDKTVFKCYNNITVFRLHSTKDFLVTVLKHTHSAHHLLTSKDVRNRGSCILLGRCSNRMM